MNTLIGRMFLLCLLMGALLAPAVTDTALASGTGLHIVAIYDEVPEGFTGSPITDPAVKATIQAAITQLERHIATPETVTIRFVDSTPNGLGGSAQAHPWLSYSTFLADLKKGPLSAYDRQALKTLPIQSGNPVNGNVNVALTRALTRAVGEPEVTGDDAVILLNVGACNILRPPAPQDPNKYDLESVTLHEIDEVLGAGGGGSQVADGDGTQPPGPLDLSRYSAPGVRSFTKDPNEKAYLSINGGTTKVSYFDNVGDGDYGDWDPRLNHVRQVQDGTGLEGETVGDLHLDLGIPEWISLDVVGWTLNASAFIDDLKASVNALPASSSVKNNLLKQLNKAQLALASNKLQTAAAQMRGFDTIVREYRSAGKLTSDQASALLKASANIQSIIGV